MTASGWGCRIAGEHLGISLRVHLLDDRLTALARGQGWTYTRYADDLAFSTQNRVNRGRAAGIARLAERELSVFGLAMNRQKTTIVSPGGRKILLGVLVDRHQPRLTRELRNNIETHLYALTSPKIGPLSHTENARFCSGHRDEAAH